MTPQEVAALLSIAAAYDNRKPDPEAVTAWTYALDGLRFNDCRDAIVAHYRASNEWLMPNKVITEVKRIRAKRLADYGALAEPPAHIDPDNTAVYGRWLAETRRAIADGDLTPGPLAIEPPAVTKRMEQLRRDAAAGVRAGLEVAATREARVVRPRPEFVEPSAVNVAEESADV